MTTQAARLAGMFAENFKTFEAEAADDVRRARARMPEALRSPRSFIARSKPVIGLRDPRPTADRNQDLLRLQHRVRRTAEQSRLSRFASGFPARCRC